jgi:hypothetical protein
MDGELAEGGGQKMTTEKRYIVQLGFSRDVYWYEQIFVEKMLKNTYESVVLAFLKALFREDNASRIYKANIMLNSSYKNILNSSY